MAHSKTFVMTLRNATNKNFSKRAIASQPKRKQSFSDKAQPVRSDATAPRASRATKVIRTGWRAKMSTKTKYSTVKMPLAELYQSENAAKTRRRGINRSVSGSDNGDDGPFTKHQKAIKSSPSSDEWHDQTNAKYHDRKKRTLDPDHCNNCVPLKRRRIQKFIPDSDESDDIDLLQQPTVQYASDLETADINVPFEPDFLSSSRYVIDKNRAVDGCRLSYGHGTARSTYGMARKRRAAIRHSSAVDQMLSTLPTHTPKLREITELLFAQKWHELDRIPANVRRACQNVPALIPSERCWVAGKSPYSALHLAAEAVLNLSPDEYVIEDNGTGAAKKKPIRDVISQLFEPPLEGPLIAHNVPTVEAKRFDIAAISNKITPPPKDHIYSAMNVTPANTVVDIHVDQGTNGLSVGVGRDEDPWQIKVHKVWLFWPPTERNLATYEELKQSKDLRLLRSSELHDGIITAFGIHHGIFIPAGWLHATVTTRSGFLGGINIHSPDTILMASKIKSMDLRLMPYEVSQHLYNFQDAIEVALDPSVAEPKRSLHLAIQGWFEIEAALSKIKINMGHNRSQCSKILDAWGTILDQHPEFDDRCCGCWAGRGERRDGCCSCKSKKKRFRKHFWTEHLAFLQPSKYEVPSFARQQR